jgi:hypothetical protein
MVKAMPGYWDLDRCAWVVLNPAVAPPSSVPAGRGTEPDPAVPEPRSEPRETPAPTTVTAD